MAIEYRYLRVKVAGAIDARAQSRRVRIDTARPGPDGRPMRTPLAWIDEDKLVGYYLKDPKGSLWVVLADENGGETAQQVVESKTRYIFGDTSVLTPHQCILFLSANPRDERNMRLEAELRDVREEIDQSTYRDDFVIENRGALRFKDLRRVLQKLKPTYLHFSGHGNIEGNILIEGDDGNARPLAPGDLAALVKGTRQTLLRCIVLSACYSKEHALQLAELLPGITVIAMRSSISEQGSCRFACGFYNSIAEGANIPDAFDVGVSDLHHNYPGEAWMVGLFPECR